MKHIEVGFEFLHTVIGSRCSDRPPDGFHIQLQRRRRQPGINAGHRQPVKLAASMRRSVGRAPGERTQILRDIGKMRRERQFAAEDVQLLEVKAQYAATLQAQGSAHHFRRHERVAVAVAANPASHPQKRRQLSARAITHLVQPVLQGTMQPRHFMQEGVIIKREAVGDLVEYGELGTAQQIGLPQRQHRAAQLLGVCLKFLRRDLDALAPVQQPGDLHLAVHRALASDFRGVRGQHRADLCTFEKPAQIGRGKAGRVRM